MTRSVTRPPEVFASPPEDRGLDRRVAAVMEAPSCPFACDARNLAKVAANHLDDKTSGRITRDRDWWASHTGLTPKAVTRAWADLTAPQDPAWRLFGCRRHRRGANDYLLLLDQLAVLEQWLTQERSKSTFQENGHESRTVSLERSKSSFQEKGPKSAKSRKVEIDPLERSKSAYQISRSCTPTQDLKNPAPSAPATRAREAPDPPPAAGNGKVQPVAKPATGISTSQGHARKANPNGPNGDPFDDDRRRQKLLDDMAADQGISRGQMLDVVKAVKAMDHGGRNVPLPPPGGWTANLAGRVH